MSAWRRRALEAFPELRRELGDRREMHLMDHPGDWDGVLARLSDATIANVWGLWELRLGEAKTAEIAKLPERMRRPVPAARR